MNEYICWRANLHATLDIEYLTLSIDPVKSRVLEDQLSEQDDCFLVLEAGFDVEIIKVLAACGGMLTIQRGLQGTVANVWPAGTPIEARITAKTLDDLRINPCEILLQNKQACLAPNGDLITFVVD